MIFVDPKGIRNLGPTDPKIQFHPTIKEIEQRLGDATFARIRSSCPTRHRTPCELWGWTRPTMTQRHILFQEEDKETYVRSMLEMVDFEGTSTPAHSSRS